MISIIVKYLFRVIVSLFIISCGVRESSKATSQLNGEIESSNDFILMGKSFISTNGDEKLDESRYQFVIIDPFYIDYEYNFEPLTDEEILLFNHKHGGVQEKPYEVNGEEFTFRLSGKNTLTGKERIIGYWNSYQSEYQISNDGKSGIFFFTNNKRNKPLFKIDGKNGTVRYLMDTNLSAMSSYDLNFLLVNFDGHGLLSLYDLKNNVYLRTIEWRKSDVLWSGGTYEIKRSSNPLYDFRIIFSYEYPYIFAIANYNIENNQLETEFDVTDNDEPYKYAKKYKSGLSAN